MSTIATPRGEFWVNDPSRVFVARAGRHELTSTILTTAQVQELVERMLKSSGRRVDLSQPFVDAMLPGGHRLHVVLEGISRGFSAVNVRKFVVRAAHLHDLVGLGSLTAPAAAFLDASVRAGLNLVVSGSTQAGKTTMLNCLAASIPGRERVVSVEEVFELRLSHPETYPISMQHRLQMFNAARNKRAAVAGRGRGQRHQSPDPRRAVVRVSTRGQHAVGREHAADLVAAGRVRVTAGRGSDSQDLRTLPLRQGQVLVENGVLFGEIEAGGYDRITLNTGAGSDDDGDQALDRALDGAAMEAGTD